MSDIKNVIKQLKTDINRRITSKMDFYKKECGLISSSSIKALNRIDVFAQGGKGIRGGLFIFSSELFGYSNRDTLLDLATSLEILQASLLIHDDIMDNDFIRRGNPSIFAQYIEDGKMDSIHDAESYGRSMGICVGDVGFFMALQIASNALENHQNKNKLLDLLHTELVRVVLAQMDDVTFAVSAGFPTKEEILKMYTYKTAHYTFSLPLSLGAIITNQDSHVIDAMEKLGEYMGLLFQLKDDEIGIYSDEKTIGKPISSDLRENKKTFIRTLLETKINDVERTRLESFIGNPDIHTQDVAFYRSLLEKYHIKRYTEEMVESYSKQANLIIDAFDINEKNKILLRELILYVVTRRS
jgi:geranylgeranyl diphosphate synthase type I